MIAHEVFSFLRNKHVEHDTWMGFSSPDDNTYCKYDRIDSFDIQRKDLPNNLIYNRPKTILNNLLSKDLPDEPSVSLLFIEIINRENTDIAFLLYNPKYNNSVSMEFNNFQSIRGK